MSPPAIAGDVLALSVTAAGVGLLRRAWRRPDDTPALILGWALLLSAAPLWALGSGWDKAVALALLVPSLAGYAAVAAGAQVHRRAKRAGRTTIEPHDRFRGATWRGVVRLLYAGPLAGAAALLLGAAWVQRGAGSLPLRGALSLLLTPVVWAAGVVWATTDRRLPRVGAGLVALAGAGALAAWL